MVEYRKKLHRKTKDSPYMDFAEIGGHANWLEVYSSSSNSRYIKARKDVLICGKMKVESVDCVADGIYVRGCSEAIDKLNDDDSDIIAARYSSKNLFYMDINGENRERLCRE